MDKSGKSLFNLETESEIVDGKNVYVKSAREYEEDIRRKAEDLRGHETQELNFSRVQAPFYKRAMDILISGSALLLLSPVFIVVAILLKLESKGPVFFLSKRVGAGYRVFDLYKFRTMVVGAENKIKEMSHLNMYKGAETAEAEDNSKSKLCEECIRLKKTCDGVQLFDNTGEFVCENLYLKQKKTQAAFVKFKNDPRITRLGKFLRNSSVDELPQLINILIGDMSLVGNRPLPLYEAEKLTTDRYTKRFLAPAGLTGLWQVSKRGKGDMSEEERIALDNEYADNYGFTMDMKIILRTFPALLQSETV
ncbi:MAG: sugar transferase [Bacteroidota bacterium]